MVPSSKPRPPDLRSANLSFAARLGIAVRDKFSGDAPSVYAATMFGSLVHQTIEDVHKSFLRGETFDEERINGWFNLNYVSLSL